MGWGTGGLFRELEMGSDLQGAPHTPVSLLFCQGPPSFPCSLRQPLESTLTSFFRHVPPFPRQYSIFPRWHWPSPGVPHTAHLASFSPHLYQTTRQPRGGRCLSGLWPLPCPHAPLSAPSFPLLPRFLSPGLGIKLTHASFNCQLDNSQESPEEEPQCRAFLL